MAPVEPRFFRSDWVKLRDLPSAYSFDEALLLCECAEEGRWVAWVPDFGEIVLEANQMM
jgi:hypothetical protein